ncbi:switch 2 isoform X1 [Amborella trichopoda]|uniref:Switch 2 n=1 Tax=Amborella trichopoda TaxID=13333 RepID=U5D0T9_AMBTC|nr:switch 2 isoform X1 [Amborella trichopoda]ERN15007.1 hypothetical protein AMTR_s00032p00230880 [Amborella trichopoda]|eukprot:XP_006853540.1 switch 2 isoform X1 [Amborella trichopoda]
MSLNKLKESLLKPCSSSSSSSSYSSSSLPSLLSNTSDQAFRKPPKSSIKHQLQRIHGDDPLTILPPENNLGCKNESDFSSHGVSDRVTPVLVRPETQGIFEPLILSSPGDSPVVQVPASINCRLLEHQREGVRFLYGLYKNNHGGILGDDMGLGKTIQTIAFLVAVLGADAEHSENQMLTGDILKNKSLTLIVCPTSIIQNWENEFSEWGSFDVAVYHGSNRDLILDKIKTKHVEILITSFDTFRIYDTILSEVEWDIVIVDEAHRLKNEKSKVYKALSRIRTNKRYGLTGTIMQNKILELFNLFDWVAPGSLGTREHFREFYDEPLKHGQRLSAPERFVRIADKRKNHLVAVLSKYLLRRTKEETIGHLMMGKEDNVVFCAMSEVQKRVYKRVLELPDIQCLMDKDLPCTCGSPLTRVECCHRTVPSGIIWSYLHRENPEGCDSCPYCLVLPCLVKLQQISNHLELIKPHPRDDVDKQKKDADFAATVFARDAELVGGITQNESFVGLSDSEHCGKLRALERLLFSWISRGDKILLFSYSVRMLNILEKFIIRKGYCFSRLDGSTPINSRQSLVDEFNSSPSKQVFLISTRAGGLGLNLMSANRVVIFDPNWNPAQDLQAQDRSFRYGQKRHVTVFRLLAAGSLEELVYTRQIYKQQLFSIAVSGNMEKRYFEGVQDCKNFKGELFGICNLFRDLSDKRFASEIIEQQGRHTQDKTGCETDYVTESLHNSSQVNKALLSNGEAAVQSKREREPMVADLLEELGIMYAHRNEDVVNFGSNPQGRVAGICKSVSMDSSDKNTTNPKKRKLSAPDLLNNTTECGSKLRN